MIRTRFASIAATTAVAAVLGLVAAGCGNNDDLGSAPPIRDGGSSQAADGASGSDSDNDGGNGGGNGGGDPDTTGGPVGGGGGDGVPPVSRTTQIEAAEGVAGTLEIGFAGLEVDGRLATLTLVYTPRYDTDPAGTISLFDMFARNVAEVTLVDSVNLLRYLVVEDSRGLELGPFPATVETRNDEPVAASYTFAAPPADVEAVDVYVDDRKIFNNVDVTR